MASAATPNSRPTVVPVAVLAGALLPGHADGEASPSDVDATWPRIPAYRLARLLGEGSGGQVYEAFRVGGSQMPVALKVIRQPLGSAGHVPGLARVWRELDILSELRLECVPRVLDWGTSDGRMFIATELVPGADLEEHCTRAQLHMRQRVELLAEVCDAVSAIHDALVVHRDLKPSNILVDKRGRVFIVDFGVARLDDNESGATLTLTGEVIGTTPFMAPEVALGDKASLRSVRADVYSLGATAYVVLTGRPPRQEKTTTLARLKEAAEGQTRDPRSLRPDMPRPLAAVLRRACERDPEGRYASARELGDDLRRWLDGTPVRAQARRWARGIEWITGHPAATTGALCMLMLCASVASIAGYRWWYLLQPDRVVVDDAGTTVKLVSRAALPLMSWGGTSPHDVVFGGEARTGRGDERIGVLALRGCASGPLGERLVMFRFDRAESPFLISQPGDPDLVAPQDAKPGGRYRVAWADVADVFPQVPGQEVLAIFTEQSSCESCVRVYTTEGEVLFEAWHFGRVHSAQWLSGDKVLVVAGVTNHPDALAATRLATGESRCVPIVFALAPRPGMPKHWVGTKPGEPSSLIWYRYLRPLSACVVLNDATVGPSFDPAQRGDLAILHAMGSDPLGLVHVQWDLSSTGEVERGTPSNRYTQLTGAVSWERLSWSPGIEDGDEPAPGLPAHPPRESR
ncbi:MAG TPA: serine/threonine-protein kinase [Phycisphaerales bacterium]|nr:serine/threonine-protein kinase [Phycisphaerales bacterium]